MQKLIAILIPSLIIIYYRFLEDNSMVKHTDTESVSVFKPIRFGTSTVLFKQVVYDILEENASEVRTTNLKITYQSIPDSDIILCYRN